MHPGRIARLLSCGILWLSFAATASGQATAGRPPVDRSAPHYYNGPPNAPYRALAVTVPTRAGHTLVGTLTLPNGAGPGRRVPAVVTITGSGPQDRDEDVSIDPSIPLHGYRPFRQYADVLGRRGIAVLRMDERGVGGSTGDFRSSTSADFAEDIRDGLAFLRTRPEIDPNRLGLVGHSEGGFVAPMVALDEPALRAIVLLAGPAEGARPILEYQLANWIRRDSTLAGHRLDSALATVPLTIDSLRRHDVWMRWFLDYDPVVTARKVRTPVLILNGGNDRQATPEQATKLAAAFVAGGNRDVTLRIFPELNHLFLHDLDGSPAGYAAIRDTQVRPEVLTMVADWLVRRLR